MTQPAGWDGILDANEAILWQGRPNGDLVWKPGNWVTMVFGVAFAGFALFWMIMAAQAGGLFWAFGLIHFFVGLGIAIGPPFWNAWRRRHTWYTLTDRRAFIATDMPLVGRRLKSYPVTDETVLEFTPEEPATIFFAHEYKRGKNGSYRVGIGFERIDDGHDVFAKFRKIQKDAV
jgi:hypothetical protein